MKVGTTMSQKWTISLYLASFLCISCHSANLDYSFNGASFDFCNWQKGSEGFQCPNDNRYVILCQFRWDSIVKELAQCNLLGRFLSCAQGTSATLFAVIGIKAITIGMLSLYIRKKRRMMKEKEVVHGNC